MTRLTKRRLRAMEGALAAMAAGIEGEGDWPDGVTLADMNTALDWIGEQLRKRERK